MFWMYILECADGSYYTGHTDNLDARLACHQAGAVNGHTCSRRPVRLVFSQSFASRVEALAAERQVKGWRREKKAAMIAGDWTAVQLLARGEK